MGWYTDPAAVFSRGKVLKMAWIAFFCAAGLSLTVPAMALADSARFSIAAQPLPQALKAFAAQAHMQLLYRYSAVANAKGNAVSGDLEKHAALEQLLKDSGLEVVYSSDSAATIRPAHSIAVSNVRSSDPPSGGGAQAPPTGDSLRLAQATPGQTSSTPAVEEKTVLQEVIVTAQKREERLQDVPVPVTVVSTDALVENNQPRLQDFYNSVPGLNMSPPAGGSNEQNLAIRGITSGAGSSPTVAVTVDDMPYGLATGFNGDIVPDLDPADLARIEVLRGPQGTLYGASGLGGVIKYVTVDPSTDGVSGRVQAGSSSVYNGAELGYSVRASVNVPLSDTIAVRASGFTREDPGYIDNPVRHIDGINEEHVSGGRVSALWRVGDTFSLKISALYQDDKGDGASEVNLPTAGYPQSVGFGNLQQNYIPGTGGYERKTQAYSVILNGKVGNADLTSVSGYNSTHATSSLDYSYAFGGIAQNAFGVAGVPFIYDDPFTNFSEELRASLPIGQKVNWLLGAFFTHQVDGESVFFGAEDPSTGAIKGDILSSGPASPGKGATYQEIAAFTDVTIQLTDRFDVQIGGRESQMWTGGDAGYSAGLFAGNKVVLGAGASREKSNAFTYLLTPRFKISPDLMTYIRLASGYRPGGGVANPTPTPGSCVTDHFPCQFKPDTTRNYEIGMKGDVFDHLLSFDASLYYIDWRDIQFNAIDPITTLTYTTNGSGAKSEGVELSVETKPLKGLVVSMWGAYNDAVLTKDFPSGSSYYGVSGNRLPFSTHFSGNVSANQDVVVTANATAFAGLTVGYQGNSVGNFDPTPDRQLYSPYATTDLRAGVKYGGSWKCSLYVNNVADRRAVIGGGGAFNFPPYGYVVIRPRTVGLTLQRTF
jgi:iron complex outermembrane receptor protein